MTGACDRPPAPVYRSANRIDDTSIRTVTPQQMLAMNRSVIVNLHQS